MKWVRMAGLVLALSCFGGAEAAVAQVAGATRPSGLAEQRCSGASSQAETLGCYDDLVATSRAKLLREYERDLKVALAEDKAFNAYARERGILGSFLAKRLRESQAAWLQYSKAQCAFEGGSSFGGSGEDILDRACHYRLNVSRLAELQAAREGLER